MTDLSLTLPTFNPQPHAHLIPSLEKHLITTTDLLTLSSAELASRARLPPKDVSTLCSAVLEALQTELQSDALRHTGRELVSRWQVISTLDEGIDRALGGGLPTGYVSEITGESGVGKTQFLLTLLLAVQLPAPHGISKSALYISTESALPTSRLTQMLETHPMLVAADQGERPSLDRVISIVTPDLESQDHILRFQVPVAVRRHGVGLVVLDSVAANYRAEFEGPGTGTGAGGGRRNAANMAKRSAELVKLGQLLRHLAREENIAVVVANQVGDRFTSFSTGNEFHENPTFNANTTANGHFPRSQDSPLAYRSGPLPSIAKDPTINNPHSTTTSHHHHHDRIHSPFPSAPADLPSSSTSIPDPNVFPLTPAPGPGISTGISPFPLTLDHQQRWFTGWGDDPFETSNLKTPSLGLVWTSQIACRIALLKTPVVGGAMRGREERGRWRRWVKVVFAPWVRASSVPGVGGKVLEEDGDGETGEVVEVEVWGGGVRSLGR